MRTSNPVFGDKTFSETRSSGGVMTIEGTVNRTLVLLTLLCVSAFFTWSKFRSGSADVMPWAVAGALGGFVIGLVTCFVKRIAPFTSPVYAICEGLCLGALSALLEAKYKGIALEAVLLTSGTLFLVLGLYRFGIIRATESFKLGVCSATGAIALVYIVGWILRLFGHGIPYIHESGMIGIGFSLFVVVVAALNFVLDFDFVEQGAANGAPKYMEWYAAFGLMVTLVWLYVEILRLLSKLRNR